MFLIVMVISLFILLSYSRPSVTKLGKAIQPGYQSATIMSSDPV